MICVDDATDQTKVPGIYKQLLDDEKVDLVVGGYGDNSVAPAMSIVIERNRYFVTLMALASNTSHNYANFFVMIPTGPHPSEGLTEGFFELAATQVPKPETMAILAADALFAKSPVAGAKTHASTHGFRIIADEEYDLSTTDFWPVISKLEGSEPRYIVYVHVSEGYGRNTSGCGCPRAHAKDYRRRDDWTPKRRGQIGARSTSQRRGELRVLAARAEDDVPGIGEMIKEYQARAGAVGADPRWGTTSPRRLTLKCRSLSRPSAGTASLDDEELARFTRENTFSTILGDVKFGSGGAWSDSPRSAGPVPRHP